jgi:hypothetical protein
MTSFNNVRDACAEHKQAADLNSKTSHHEAYPSRAGLPLVQRDARQSRNVRQRLIEKLEKLLNPVKRRMNYVSGLRRIRQLLQQDDFSYRYQVAVEPTSGTEGKGKERKGTSGVLFEIDFDLEVNAELQVLVSQSCAIHGVGGKSERANERGR